MRTEAQIAKYKADSINNKISMYIPPAMPSVLYL